MLRTLTVRDFAIVEAVEISLDSGLTVVSGETGAGKSLLVDALLLLSGARADSAAVRAGCERAELSARFDLADIPAARAWLREHELDDDGEECLLRRVIRRDGPSRAWINGRPVPNQTLAEMAVHLVEIHGQHEHQALLDRRSQLALVDRHGEHRALLQQVARYAGHWQQLEHERRTLQSDTGDDGRRIELLRHDLAELQRHALAPEACAELERGHHRLAHMGATLEACMQAASLLDGGDEPGTILALLAKARQALERAQAGDPDLAATTAVLANAEIELGEAASTLAGHLDGFENDPEQFERLDRQLARLHDLGRKHRLPIAELAAARDRLAAELDAAENAGERLQQILAQQQQVAGQWLEVARQLSQARQTTAQRLSREVSMLICELGMAGGQFQIALEEVAGQQPDAQGLERTEFMVSANPGQPLRPLRRVASGGELSRIALAIEVAALGEVPVPTMVFDEVDVGIGGAVAEILGQKLRRLGERVQVLCVTHLPQVAAQGHHHFAVAKQVVDGDTATLVTHLEGAARRGEIGRMLGGVQLTDTTLAHAQQMLAQAGN
ncbi:MAG: DNA repair protein RecN [Xanthomonadales bacterium]|nr:DNA repair protein RecN [Xanthomonadales bacterium]